MNMYKALRLLSKYLLVCFFYFMCTHGAHAALLYFDPNSANVYRGDTITMSLRLDTDEGECINTVDAVIHYDPAIRAVDISRGKSILNVWLEEPKIDEVNHTIHFAGGIPGGYCGRIPGDPSLTNILIELVFRSPGFSVGGGNNPTARIWVEENAQVLLHDGTGMPAPLRLQEAIIDLASAPGSSPVDTWNDEIKQDKDIPADFSIVLTRDDTAFSGQFFIVFNSQDKQSGIDHYEVMEEPFSEFYAFRWGRADAPWVVSESPYVLKDQTLNSTIRVKVLDKAGNSRIVTLVPDVALRSMSIDMRLTVFFVGAVVVLLSSFIGYALWRRKQRLLRDEEEKGSTHV